jgi:hypothetical protein
MLSIDTIITDPYAAIMTTVDRIDRKLTILLWILIVGFSVNIALMWYLVYLLAYLPR